MDLEQVRAETNKTIVELLSTPYSNTVFIGQKEKIMQTVVDTAKEAHPAPLIALGLVKVMLGKTADATTIANLIWEMGGKNSSILESLFVYQLNSLGIFNRSLVLIKPKMSSSIDVRREFEGFKQNALRCAIGLGDFDMLERLVELEEFSSEKDMISLFIKHMDKRMLKQHFKTHQEIINKIVEGKQVGYEVSFDELDGYPSLEVGIFVGGDSVDRYQLQQQIDDAYANYYIENKISPLDNFAVSVYDIKQHWALEN